MTELLFNATSIAPSSAPALVNDEAVNDLSPGARRLLNEFPSVPEIYMKQVVAPPGLAGEFVRAAMSASHRPFLKFAIPSTLATLSGIIGRRYKIDALGSGGLALNFIVAAASGAGKSDSIKAWEGFCWAASRRVYSNEALMAHRVHLHDTRSIQGIMEDFIECPAAVWANDEAGALLRAILDPKTRTDEELRDSFNKLFDASEHQRRFAPPKSVRLKSAGEKPISNISMSVILALPLNEFELPNANALNGFLARTVVIRHKGRTVNKVAHPEPRLPDRLLTRLVDLIRRAKELDDHYVFEQLDEALKQSVQINFNSVAEFHADIDEKLDKIVQQGMDDESVYTALNRASVLAKRIAGTLAVIENPNAPTVSIEQMQWAFGYVLQNFASILSDFDTGDIGDMASDEEEAVKRTIRDMLKKNSKWRKIGGVPKKELRDKIKHRAPFSAFKTGKGQVITKVIDDMLANGVLVVVEDPDAGTVGPRTTYLALSETL